MAPDLEFLIESAEVAPFAATPSLLFKLHLEERQALPVRSISLQAQVRIATAQRHYGPGEQERLRELFGPSSRWGETLKSMLWTLAQVQVPQFIGSTAVDLPVPCTYDFEVVSAKYFHAVEDGEVPLEFLFSGTVFYTGPAGLQVAQIPWDREATFRMPVRLWKEMMEHYFPNSAWLRLHRDTFDRLYRYRTRRGLSTWEAALDELLRTAAERDG